MLGADAYMGQQPLVVIIGSSSCSFLCIEVKHVHSGIVALYYCLMQCMICHRGSQLRATIPRVSCASKSLSQEWQEG